MYDVWKVLQVPWTRVHYMLKLTQYMLVKITCSRSARQIAQYIWSHSTLIRTAQRKQIVWSHLPTANISIRSWQTGHEDSSSLRCMLVFLPVAIISTCIFHFNTSHCMMTSTHQNYRTKTDDSISQAMSTRATQHNMADYAKNRFVKVENENYQQARTSSRSFMSVRWCEKATPNNLQPSRLQFTTCFIDVTAVNSRSYGWFVDVTRVL